MKNTHKNIISAYSLLRCSVTVLYVLTSYIISITDHIHIINDICYILRKQENKIYGEVGRIKKIHTSYFYLFYMQKIAHAKLHFFTYL